MTVELGGGDQFHKLVSMPSKVLLPQARLNEWRAICAHCFAASFTEPFVRPTCIHSCVAAAMATARQDLETSG